MNVESYDYKVTYFTSGDLTSAKAKISSPGPGGLPGIIMPPLNRKVQQLMLYTTAKCKNKKIGRASCRERV